MNQSGIIDFNIQEIIYLISKYSRKFGIMKIVTYFLIFLTHFLAAAHFLRFSNILIFILFLFLPFLIFIKKRWSDFIVLLSLFISFGIFLDTTYAIIVSRVQSGSDFKRFLVIMGVVLLLQFAGIILFLMERSAELLTTEKKKK